MFLLAPLATKYLLTLHFLSAFTSFSVFAWQLDITDIAITWNCALHVDDHYYNVLCASVLKARAAAV